MPGRERNAMKQRAQTRVITNLQTENLIPAPTFSDFEQIAAWIPTGFSSSVGQERSTQSIRLGSVDRVEDDNAKENDARLPK